MISEEEYYALAVEAARDAYAEALSMLKILSHTRFQAIVSSISDPTLAKFKASTLAAHLRLGFVIEIMEEYRIDLGDYASKKVTDPTSVYQSAAKVDVALEDSTNSIQRCVEGLSGCKSAPQISIDLYATLTVEVSELVEKNGALLGEMLATFESFRADRQRRNES